MIIEIISLAVTAVAVIGVILNNHKHIGCFYLWMVSNAVTAYLHIQAGLWGLTVRDVIFFVLAVYGLKMWTGTDGAEKKRTLITRIKNGFHGFFKRLKTGS